MTPLHMHPSDRFDSPSNGRPQPWQTPPLVDRAPPLKPLVMGGTRPPPAASGTVRTHWQPGSMPVFPIEPANDPVRQLAENERTSMTLLTLVMYATITVAVLGYGLQALQ